jgi:hypothetical protein
MVSEYFSLEPVLSHKPLSGTGSPKYEIENMD